MGFLAPWFLAGLAAVSLPLWLHLLKQHRSDPIKFSSLKLFERRPQSSVKHRRLKYLMLLALRLAVLALLALAFANPFIRRSPTAIASGTKLVIVAVDRSFSMRSGDALERAKAGARGIINGLGASDKGQVVALSGRTELLTQAIREKPELLGAIASMEAGDGRGSLGELSRTLRSLAEAAKQPVEVHFFSDLQKSSLPPGFNDLKLGPMTNLVTHEIAPSKRENWAVESVQAPRTMGDPKATKILATITGYDTASAKKPVSLWLNGRQQAAKLATLGPNGRVNVEFLGLEAPYGWSRGEVRIEGGDALAADDVYRFAIERADSRRILFVREARQARSGFYFKSALGAAGNANFAVDEVTPDQTGGIDPSKFAFVVLNDPAFLPESFVDALKRRVTAGGRLLITAGPGIAGQERVPVLEAKVEQSKYASRSGERFLTVIKPDATHPAIAKADRLEGVKFYQAVRIEAGNLRMLARLNEGTPLLAERTMGEGRVLFFSSTFDNIANDFPLNPSFVPFVEQTALYLSNADERPSSAMVDSFLELRTPGEAAKASRQVSIEVLDPAGKRALTLEESVKAPTLTLSSEGFWEVGRQSGRELVAVNADRRESDLSLLPKETVEIWKKMGTETAAQSSGGPEEQKPWSFWWWLALLLLIVTVAESLFAHQYLKTERPGA
ncbi:MAG: BatA domain-containing protein [Bryobacteraceae bacterium]|nr:BatA domain-containing protein [Bryobacteraceae bacterium]